MADFINTIDVIDDNVLARSIVDGSVVEFCDDAATSIGTYVFYKCSALATANFPAATSVGNNAFRDCTSLTTANMPAATSIGTNAFQKCSALATANFPAATSVGNGAFQFCNALTNLDFPAVTKVDGYAFRQCALLTTLDFPVANNISDYVFYYSAKFTALILRNQSQVFLAGTRAFEGTPIASGTGYIYVPAALIDSYKAATNWSTYANQFRALEDYTLDGTTAGEVDTTRCMVRFFNDDGTLLDYKVIPNGGSATYDGAPVCSEDASWAFKGFLPEPTNVTEDMDCYAQYQEPFSLETASWARISEISAEGTGANYMSVGDTKSIALNGTMGTLELDGTFLVYIMDFNHNSEIEGTGIHFGGFKSDVGGDAKNLCLVDSIVGTDSTDGTKAFNMNHWGYKNFGGWKRSDLRYDILGSTDVPPQGYGAVPVAGQVGYDATVTCATNPVPNTLMSCLPADLRAVMKPITKYTDNVAGKIRPISAATASVDYLPLLGIYEVSSSVNNVPNTNEYSYQTVYSYFSNTSYLKKYRYSDVNKSEDWYTRSPGVSADYGFAVYNENGVAANRYCCESCGISPVFMV